MIKNNIILIYSIITHILLIGSYLLYNNLFNLQTILYILGHFVLIIYFIDKLKKNDNILVIKKHINIIILIISRCFLCLYGILMFCNELFISKMNLYSYKKEHLLYYTNDIINIIFIIAQLLFVIIINIDYNYEKKITDSDPNSNRINHNNQINSCVICIFLMFSIFISFKMYYYLDTNINYKNIILGISLSLINLLCIYLFIDSAIKYKNNENLLFVI